MYTAFKQYLLKLKLSPISRKLYLSDVARFLNSLGPDPTLDQVTSPISYTKYLKQLEEQLLAPSMLKRTTASLKQFGNFISHTYSLKNPLLFLSNSPSTSTSDYIKHFINYLNSDHLSPLTIKSYKSDITRYMDYTLAHSLSTKMSELLSDKNIEKYLNHLSELASTLPSTIERKSKSLSRIKSWYRNVYLKNYTPDNNQSPSYSTTPTVELPQPNRDLSSPDQNLSIVKSKDYRKPYFKFIPNLLTMALLLVFASGLAIFGYQQFARDVRLTSAFPNTPVTPNRQLSFQGRLENAAGTPITTATDITFKLWDSVTSGSQLYSSGVCSLTPDSDGVFTTQIGSTCGSAIASSVFTENASVWLEVTVVAETLTPRQPIASVAYALNSETIQGFPISATVSAIRNTVVPMNQWGEIIVGEQSPRLTGVSGTFQISAPALSFITTTGTNGNITLAPDGTGQVNLNGNTTSTNFFNVSNAQLTTGSLITGTVANNNSGYYLLNLLSGSSPTSKFSINNAGNTTIAGTLTLPNTNTLTGVSNYTQFSQGVSVGGGTTYYFNSSGNINANTGTFGGTLQANGTFDANGQVDLGDGGDALTLNGSSITLTGFNCSTNTNGGTLTTNGSGVLQCADDDGGGGGGGSSNWVSNLGSLAPINSTWDVLVGGTATSSAKAGFININSGTPTATVSAGVAGGAYLTATGNLATTANQTLTLGNATTGNIVLAPGGVTALTASGANLTTPGTFTLPNTNTLTGVSNYTQFSQGISVGGGTTYYLNSSGNLNAGSGTFAQTLTANGNTVLGNAITDTIDFQGRVLQDSDLIPITTTGTNDLGSSSLPWDNLYVNSLALPSFTPGSVIFAGASGVLSQDNTSFYFDDTNNRLGLGTTTPSELLTLHSNNAQDLFGVYDGANNPNLVISAGGGVTVKNSAFDAVYQFNGVATYTDRTTLAKQTGGSSYAVFAVEASSNDEFYLGLDHPFDSFDVWMGTAGVGVTLTARYWNGSAWTSVALTDGTSNLTSDGTVTFTAPSNWATNSVNGTTKYWLDLRSAGTNISTAPTIHAITPGGNVRWQFFANAGDTNPVISSNRYGTIGVGTTSQQNLFEITDPKEYNVPSLYDKVWAYPLVLSNKDNTNNSGTGIAFLDSDGLSNVGSSIVFKRTGSNSQGELIFYTKQSTTSGVAPVQAMVINNAGNLGVGTTNPGYRLEVSGGDAQFDQAVYFAGGTTYYVDSSGNAKFLDLQVADTGNAGLTVGNGTTGFAKFGSATIGDNASTYLSFDTNSDAADEFRIYDDGSLTLKNVSSVSNSSEATVYYDTDVNHLYLSDGAAWHRVALDMTKYSNTSASVTNQSYVEIAHNQNTNDLSLTGWVYDTVTSLWKRITDWSTTTTHDLDNEFNASFTQKSKVGTVALNSTYVYGTGADGSISITADTNINTANSISGRSCADGGDAVNYSVTALTSTTATLSTTPSAGCLSVGDEVLLINLQGTSTKYVNVGNYETLRISSISTSTINFATAKNHSYGDDPGTDTNIGTATTNQRVMLQRVPNYTNVTLSNAGTDFVPSAWSAPKGGVMFFRATGTVTIPTGTTINANTLGYNNGTAGTSGVAATGGESFCAAAGTAGGSGGDSDNAPADTAGVCGGGGGGGANSAAGGNAGSAGALGGAGGAGGNAGSTAAGNGYGAGGAGGGYGAGGNGGAPGGGTASAGGNGGTFTSGTGGTGVFTTPTAWAGGGGGGGSYGDSYLNQIFLGSGGAGGGRGDSNATVTDTPVNGGAGGKGGGIVMLSAATFSVTSTGGIQANGAPGSDAANTTYAGGGGGGAGGSVKIVADTVTTSTTDLITASGGGGATTGTGADGGSGGVGRIAISYKNTLTANSAEPDFPTSPYLEESGYYGIFVSKEINTPGATALNSFGYTETLNTYGQVEVQTRTGSTADSKDGTWEAWKPVVATTNIKTLNAMDATGDWSVTNLNAAADGQLARNVDYFEDEDITTTANKSVKFGSVGSSSGYAEDTITSTDLSNFDLISAWIYATASGQIRLGIGESAATEQSETFTIDTPGTWQKIYWDISDISNSSKNAITKLRVYLHAPNQTLYLDSLQAEELITSTGTAPSSTPNSYFQYRFILTSSNGQAIPSVTGFTLTYNNGSSQTIDASSIRGSNGSNHYSSTHLTLSESTLNSLKNFNVDVSQTGVTQNGDYDPGTGADGDITISSNTSINTANSIAGRSCVDGGDAVNYSVSALTQTTATLTTNPSTPSCLQAGDEILLINLQGTSGSTLNVGNYETLRISSISGNTITFTKGKGKYYGDGTGDDTNLGTGVSNQKVMLQRVPNYSNVTVNSSVTFSPDAYDYTTGQGGVMFFRSTGTVTSAGTISATGKGYLGGTGASTYTVRSTPGQSLFYTSGLDGQGGIGSASDPDRQGQNGTFSGGGGGGKITTTVGGTAGTGTSSTSAGGGGGGGSASRYSGTGSEHGYGGGGGGGGYVTGGGGGQSLTNADDGTTSTSGAGVAATNSGNTNRAGGGGGGAGGYGDANLAKLMLGSGGGGGGTGQISTTGIQYFGGDGGDGGGIILIAANNITISGSAQSNGGDGTTGDNVFGSGGGAGAGGSVKLLGRSLTLGSSLVTASAGAITTDDTYDGGTGSVGRVAVYYADSISGSTSPASSTAQIPSYDYSLFISDEIPTPNATGYNKIKWLANLDSFGKIELQTRSGHSNNSTDGTWEAWKPVVATTNIKTLNAMDATGDWSVTNLNAAADGQLARNVDYFEDEDITTAANKSVKFGSVGSSSGYAEDTISSTNLSSSDYLTAWVYATSSGNLVKFGFGESSATEQEKTITVQSSNTWQKVYWDISNISSSARDAVTKLRISILSTNTTVYIDSLSADRYLTDSNGSTISSTPNEYLQYRAILTTTNNGYHPTLHNVQIDWSNGFKIVQTDANTVRLYNFTGDTQQLRLDAVVFGADLAEWYTVDDQTIGDGDLVALTGAMDQYGVPILRRTTDINDRQIIGAISTKAGQTLGIEAEDRRLLALAGRVPVKMDLASPSLVAGDYLTSSDKPGFARKAKPGELTIGRAFETWRHEAPNATVLAIVQQPVETPEQDLSKAILTILKDSFELWDQQANVQITRLAAYSELVAGRVTAGLVTTDTLKVATLSPLATGSAITVNGPMIIKSVTENDDSPILIVDGELDAATISARTAVLDDISAQNITAKNIVADTIEANHIIGLDAKIASFSSELSDAEVETITTRIKNRLAILTGDTPTAQDIPAPPESLNTIELDIPTQDFATNSATLATASIDFATINNYLAVIGQAIITNLDVTNTLYVDSINSKTGLIALGDNTLIIGAEGQVAINGDLTVSGKILASTAEIGSISLGNGQPSALGELLSIYNESGVEVATIDASGSANLATLTTNMITIASGGDATSSSLLSTSIATNATAGESVLISPNTDLVIESPHVTPTSLVYLTPTGNTDNKVLFVKSKNTCQDSSSNCQPSFTVGIDTPSSSDISFNWWIIGLK